MNASAVIAVGNFSCVFSCNSANKTCSPKVEGNVVLVVTEADDRGASVGTADAAQVSGEKGGFYKVNVRINVRFAADAFW